MFLMESAHSLFLRHRGINFKSWALRPHASGARLSWFVWRSILLSHPPQALAKLLQGDDDLVNGP